MKTSIEKNRSRVGDTVVKVAFAMAVGGALSIGLSASGLFDNGPVLFGREYVESEVSRAACPDDKLVIDAQRTADGNLKSVTNRCEP